MLRSIVHYLVKRYAKAYFRKHPVKLVVVTGSVGKTSTASAIATVLSEKYRVRYSDGPHTGLLRPPLAMLGVKYPTRSRSFGQWWTALRALRLRVSQPPDVDVVVQEIGSDRPGTMADYATYLQPDMVIVTAVGLGYMETFGRLETIAEEQLLLTKPAKLSVINRDDIDQRYAKYADTSSITTYGLDEGAEYRMKLDFGIQLEGVMGVFVAPDWEPLPVTLQVVGDSDIKAAVAAGLVGARLEMTAVQVATGMAKIRSVPGRMNQLCGVKESILIDDTYSSNPMSAAAALRTLYSIDAPQKIAVLGSMKGCGAISAKAHAAVGRLCNPNQLDWVVTIGQDAANHLAPAAQQNGCQVRAFSNPLMAAGFVNSVIKKDCVVLLKGSRDGVFAEETTKALLRDSADDAQLVRQDLDWLLIKERAFDVSVENQDDI